MADFRYPPPSPRAIAARQGPNATAWAYSYIRLSSAEQRLGRGEVRQEEAAQAHAQRLGMRLDSSLRDLGKSGGGEHLQTGALGGFVQRVRDGLIARYSILIVENLDRLSRMPPMLALELIIDLTKRDVEIHVLDIGQVYSTQTLNEQPGLKYSLLGELERAHRDNQTRSYRSVDNWQRKKAAARAQGRALGRRCPGWLRVVVDANGQEVYEPIPERVRILERIFTEAAANIGIGTLARRLAESETPPFGLEAQGNVRRAETPATDWTNSYIQKLLTSRRVLGEYQPYRRETDAEFIERLECDGIPLDQRGKHKRLRVPDGDPIPDHYPRVISEQAFEDAAAALRTRLRTGGPSRNTHRNLLRGICRCGECGGAMHLYSEGPWQTAPSTTRTRDELYCYSASRGRGCTQKKRFKEYRDIERIILDAVQGVLFDDGTFLANDQTAELARQIDAVDARIVELQARGKRWADEFEAGNEIARQRIASINTELAAARERRQRLDTDLRDARARHPTEHVAAVRQLRAQAESPDRNLREIARSRISLALQSITDVVLCSADRTVTALFGGGWHILIIRDGTLMESLTRLGGAKFARMVGEETRLLEDPALAAEIDALIEVVPEHTIALVGRLKARLPKAARTDKLAAD